MAQYQQNWAKVFTERQFFSIQASHLEGFVTVQVGFLENEPVQMDARVPVRVCLKSSAMHPIRFTYNRLYATTQLEDKMTLRRKGVVLNSHPN
ncbi:hypothetical protein GCK32_011798 [Trichostrongylus colubriformis]|uniref:Uncharacterized protein n=1 Tax=Trichostrongylus colubriformis TaxID=6319 RepID=A0AAN8IP68_TRICO